MSCCSETGLYSYCMPHKVFVKPTFYQPALFALCLPFPVKLFSSCFHAAGAFTWTKNTHDSSSRQTPNQHVPWDGTCRSAFVSWGWGRGVYLEMYGLEGFFSNNTFRVRKRVHPQVNKHAACVRLIQNQQSQAKFPCINHIHSTWSPVFSCIRHPDWEPANMTGCTCLLSQPVDMNWQLNYKHKSFSLFVSIGAVPAEDAAERKVEDDERMIKGIQTVKFEWGC